MTDLATLKTWLNEAEQKRHDLAMGSSVVEFWRDGRRVVYSKATLADLDSYIEDLKLQIAKACDAANGTTYARRRSIGSVFGG